MIKFSVYKILKPVEASLARDCRLGALYLLSVLPVTVNGASDGVSGMTPGGSLGNARSVFLYGLKSSIANFRFRTVFRLYYVVFPGLSCSVSRGCSM